MSYWNHIVIDGICFCADDEPPCQNKGIPSIYCLGNKEKGICPHLGWAEATDIEAAKFIPFRLLVWDRLKMWYSDIIFNIHWYLWDKCFFDRAKEINKYKTASKEDCQYWENIQATNAAKFEDWNK